jgi:hypothetical protein
MEIVNNEEYNKVVSGKIHFELMVLYAMHSDHMHEINYTIVHNMDEPLRFKNKISFSWKREDQITVIGE